MNEADNGEQGAGGGEETPSWYYTAPNEEAGTPGVAGNGDVPDYFMVDKYKSLDEQAKAYSELAPRFGGFESAPEEYALPEGIEESAVDDGIMDIFKEVGKEYNMGQKMFNDVVSKITAHQEEMMVANKEAAIEALGADAESRISNVNNWLNVNAPKEIVEKIMPMATTAEAIEALEFFIDKSKGSRVADQNAQPSAKLSQSEYAEQLMAKDQYGNLKVSMDPAYKKKMDELAQNLA